MVLMRLVAVVVVVVVVIVIVVNCNLASLFVCRYARARESVGILLHKQVVVSYIINLLIVQ